MSLRLGAALVALMLVPALAASAGAAVRYASPDGAGSSPCNPTPCSLANAVFVAEPGDQVVMQPGIYSQALDLEVACRRSRRCPTGW